MMWLVSLVKNTEEEIHLTRSGNRWYNGLGLAFEKPTIRTSKTGILVVQKLRKETQ